MSRPPTREGEEEEEEEEEEYDVSVFFAAAILAIISPGRGRPLCCRVSTCGDRMVQRTLVRVSGLRSKISRPMLQEVGIQGLVT